MAVRWDDANPGWLAVRGAERLCAYGGVRIRKPTAESVKSK